MERDRCLIYNDKKMFSKKGASLHEKYDKIIFLAYTYMYDY